jgi:hypothetical protein
MAVAHRPQYGASGVLDHAPDAPPPYVMDVATTKPAGCNTARSHDTRIRP